MKSEELFEALTDIDEELVYKAKAAQINQEQAEDEYAQPLNITITKKKFPWRAACAAMAVVIAASAGAAVLRNGNITFPSQQGSDNDANGANISLNGVSDPDASNSVSYPDDAKYVYQGDFSELTVERLGLGLFDREVFDLYNTLERRSDLVVCGTFTDDAHQSFDPTYSRDLVDHSRNTQSYNKFRIDKIIKGNNTVNEGDEIIISQSYAVYDDELLTYSGLTPMLKGDKWFYFLIKNENTDTYRATGDTDGRYHSSGLFPSYLEQTIFPLANNNLGVYNQEDYKQNIHQIVVERHLSDFKPYISNIVEYNDKPFDGNIYDSSETLEFEMAEFPGVYFIWSANNVKAVEGGAESTLYQGYPVRDLWLADINGDGKREICSSISANYSITTDEEPIPVEDVVVIDYAYGDFYYVTKYGEYDLRIDKDHSLENQTLYLAKKEYNGEKTVFEPLTINMRVKMNPNAETSTIAQEQTGETNIEDKDNTAGHEHYKIYEQFGLVDKGEKEGLYYNGKKVRWFEDYYPIDEDGNQAGWDYINEDGVVDVYAVRDFSEIERNPDGSFDPSGKLIGLKEFSEEEFNARDINAILTDKEVTHVIIASDDSIAVNSDSDDYVSTSEDSTVVETGSDIENAVRVDNENAIAVGKSDLAIEATYNYPMSEEDFLKEREENLKLAEEYKPFGVTYDQTANEWYFNGEKVRYFRDIFYSNGESLSGGKFHGTMRSLYGNGTVDIYTVRDYSRLDEEGKGKLLDIKAFEDGEFDPDAVLHES